MKKVLLGTTALVAASILAAPAMAQNKPISLGLGGYFNFAYDLVNQRDRQNVGGTTPGFGTPGAAGAGGYNESGANARDHGTLQEGEVWFLGATTLDNGLRVGARIELEAFSNGTDQIDQVWGWAESNYGRVEFGELNGAAQRMQYASPNVVWGWSSQINVYKGYTGGANNATFAGSFNGRSNLSGDASKISYFTNRNWLPLGNGGFQLGASYSPGGCEQNSTNSGNGIIGATPNFHCGNMDTLGQPGRGKYLYGLQTQVWDLAANYVGKVMDVDVALSGSWSYGKLSAPGATVDSRVGTTATTAAGFGAEQNRFANEDRKIWAVGAEFKYIGFTLGGLYRNDNAGVKGGNGWFLIRQDIAPAGTSTNLQGTALAANSIAETNRAYAVGLKYDFAPFAVGVDYQYAVSDMIRIDGTVLGNAAGDGKETVSHVILGSQYNVGPGINMQAGVDFFNFGKYGYNQGAATTATSAFYAARVNQGQVYRVGMKLDF